MKIERKIAPTYKAVEHIDYIKAQEQRLDNGIPLYTINAGNHELVRVDILFEAGEWNQDRPMLSNATISMLCEGSMFHTSEEIAEKLDFYGSYVYYNSYKHLACVSIYSLNKYLDDTVQLIEEIIKTPRFPEKEFGTFINKRRQQFTIDDQKVEIMAQKQFSRVVFGSKHPYGIVPDVHDFERIAISNLFEFHKLHFSYSSCKILVAGKVSDVHIKLLNRHFGMEKWGESGIISTPQFNVSPSDIMKHRVVKEDSVQSAMRIGKVTINKAHADFHYLNVVNMILGGYFGSRLMSNIREDKGYTYGIGSGLVSYQNAGYFVIASEVGKNVLDNAIEEVYKEINRLRDELVPESELSLVKNYMMGALLRNFDGPFSLLDSFKGILEYNQGYEYFDRMTCVLRNISPAEVRDVAQKYLAPESMHEVVAG